MELNEKTENMLGTGVAIGTGILAWEYAATVKYGNANSLFSTQRFGDALAGIIGNKMTTQIIPNWTGAAQFKPNVMGWANKTTFLGVGLLIADKIGQNFKEYKAFPALSTIVHNAGIGVTIGGAIGGIFDPPSGSGTTRGSAYNAPSPRQGNSSGGTLSWN